MNRLLPAIHQMDCHQVEIHYKRPLFDELVYLSDPNKAVQTIRMAMTKERVDYQESFWVMYLTSSNRVLALSEVGKGTTVNVLVNTVEIFQTALLLHASNLILVHNHPSGNTSASHADKVMTTKIKKACALFEMNLLDHLIITSESHLSMAEEYLL